MLKSALFVLLSIGCAKHVPATAGLSGYAGANFITTNSPCIDGILTALDYSCTTMLSVEQTAGFVVMQCTETKPNTPDWEKYNIIAVTNPKIPEPPEDQAEMICVDAHARVYLQERP